MAKRVSPQLWRVTWQGNTLFGGLPSRADAEARAERWQGERYRSGLLKHGDKGDHVEISEDKREMRDYDERWDLAQRGSPQRIIFEHQSDEPVE